eukprot:TRINITY_DN628_c2_g1_i3.p1 TRINITY_DN628_c2_g1~~TRINITY_DN628_c2_g1_i3.p1  ORF type:complete len:107 (-),score=22.12 TRINITY_DN628_c2_g1_i3:186-506(-)
MQPVHLPPGGQQHQHQQPLPVYGAMPGTASEASASPGSDAVKQCNSSLSGTDRNTPLLPPQRRLARRSRKLLLPWPRVRLQQASPALSKVTGAPPLLANDTRILYV